MNLERLLELAGVPATTPAATAPQEQAAPEQAAPEQAAPEQAAPEQEQQPAAAAKSIVDVAKMMFGMRDQIHLYHLQTESFAEHKALNDLYDAILGISDAFMEAYLGIYGRVQGEIEIKLKPYSQDGVVKDIQEFATEIKTLQEAVKEHTDLVNQLDELLNVCNKTVYLLTLK